MEWFSNIARSAEVIGQGLVKGLASGAGSIADLGVNVGYNWTTRHILGTDPAETNYADNAAGAVTWTQAQNDYERSLMVGSQVVGEITSFAAITIATAGVGGAAIGGTAAAARAATVTTRAFNPVASRTAAALETGFGAYRGHQLFTTDRAEQQTAESLSTDLARQAIADAAAERALFNDSLRRVNDELETLLEEFQQPDLSAEREQAINERVEQLASQSQILDELRQGELSPERKNELVEQLRSLDPEFDRAYRDARDNTADMGPALSSVPASNLHLNTSFQTAMAGENTEPAVIEPEGVEPNGIAGIDRNGPTSALI